MNHNEFDVIILGGGITGAGTQRDCALRGLRPLLIERSDIATGATGRNHGLLHSGARYAVNDPESAAECIRENMILRRIASHCVEETDGLFITLPEDDLGYQKTFVEACRRAGIGAQVIDPDEARRLEPSVNPGLVGAVRVPDGSVDPFRLCAANMLDAKLHGGEVRLHTEVTALIREGSAITGVRTRNRQSGVEEEYEISDGDWAYYVNVYQQEYQRYILAKGLRWDTMDDKAKYQLLKSAHSSANKKLREAYAKNNGIRMK